MTPGAAFHVRPCTALKRPRAETTPRGQDLFWILLTVSLAGFVLLSFRPNRERIREARAECRLMRQEIAELSERSAHLRRWAAALVADDPQAWASVARERYGWRAPDEIVLGHDEAPRQAVRTRPY
jgi:hypothetical protein